MKKQTTIILLSLLCFFPLKSNAQYAGGNVYTAARIGNIEAIKKFIASKPDKYTLNNALGAATVGEQLAIMKLLINAGADVDHYSSFNTSLLINAIMREKYKAAELLIKQGADVNAKGYHTIDQKIEVTWFWTPLMCASYKDNLRLVKLLLRKGADPAEKGWSESATENETSADIAAYSGHLKTMKLLLKKGSPTNKSSIYKAARGGHIKIIKYFLSKGFDINKRDPFKGRTLLLEATWWGQKDLVEFLLKKKADPGIKDLYGRTARGYAKEKGFNNILELLRQY